MKIISKRLESFIEIPSKKQQNDFKLYFLLGVIRIPFISKFFIFVFLKNFKWKFCFMDCDRMYRIIDRMQRIRDRRMKKKD